MHWTPRHSEDEVREAVSRARNLADALRHLGLRPAGHNGRTLKRLIEHYGIPVDHFDPHERQRLRRSNRVTPLGEILIAHSSYSRGHLKERLYAEGIKSRRCEMCGQDEVWQGTRMALILDHVNGVPTDHRLENLRIVCPNCAATLDTHCGRNKRLERQPKGCGYCTKDFAPRYASQRYCCRSCAARARQLPGPRLHLRKVERPSYEQLRADIVALSLLAVGRKYGVSDNAVRKWLRAYEREAVQARAETELEAAQARAEMEAA